MKQITYDKQIQLGDDSLRILNDKFYGSYLEILNAIKMQLDAMLSHHCKIMVLRVDLHTYELTSNNKLISDFNRRLRKRLKAKYQLKRIGFVWAREQEKAKSQHYHLAIFLDANKIKHPKKVIELIEHLWEDWDNPKPYTPENCYAIVHRNKKNYQQAFKRLSYLAKIRGKGYIRENVNNYSTSRIIPKLTMELS